MEVAFFTESFRPNLDGVAHEVGGLAEALGRLGHRVRVYAPHPVVGARPEREHDGNVEVIRVRSLPVPRYPQYRWALFPFSQLRGDHLGNVDVVHLHTPGIMGGTGFLTARHFDKPLVGTFHTDVWAMRESFVTGPLVGLFFRSAKWFTLGVYWRCDVTTAPTDAARRALLDRATKPFRRPIDVIPNGIEVDRFRPGISTPDWRERCGFPNAPLITYLGRLTEDKGVHRFLDGLADLPEDPRFCAIVAGVGPEDRRVIERIHSDPRLARRVRYVGGVAEAEKAALLSQSDIYVLPSTSDTSSVSLLEAMACGAAPLVTTVGGPAEMVEEGVTGRRFDPRAPGALRAGLSALLADPDGRRQISRQAVETVRATASIDSTARRFISLYEVLLSERTRGSTGDPG